MKKLLRVFTLLLVISICLQPPMHAQEPAAKGWSSWWPVFAGIAGIASTYVCYKIGYNFGKKRQEKKDRDLLATILCKNESAARNAMTDGARKDQQVSGVFAISDSVLNDAKTKKFFTDNAAILKSQRAPNLLVLDQPTELYQVAAALDMQDLSHELYHGSQR